MGSHASSLSPPEEARLVAALTPVDVQGVELERLGVDGDGGYLVPKGEAYSYHVCLGVGDDVTFENAILPRVGGVVCYDHTVRGLPGHALPGVRWVAKGVGEKPEGALTTLPKILEGLPSSGLSLKMDIEGWEIPVMRTLTRDDLDRFDLVVAEFHCIGNTGDGGGGDQGPVKDPAEKLSCLERLAETHHLVHVHTPPHVKPLVLSNGVGMPYVAELTYVRKKDRAAGPCAREFPCAMDQTVGHHLHRLRRRKALSYLRRVRG